MSPPYRVLLHNDNYNKREYVVQVLMKVIPGMTVDNAVNIMQEAHINGMSVVIICAQVDAEDHCMQLRGNGLLSSVEPASGGWLEMVVVEAMRGGRRWWYYRRKSRKMSPPYRVLLHNDNYNKREYVVQVLMKVIPGMTVDNAVNIMQEAHINGMSVVIICAQVDAEDHCMQLRGNGLLSSVEPASGGC
ncbi:hypothetical protein TEA_010734 [Camellia sinensis var. sinensis]|uniref:Adaptor protein ClpS core domain-containing protein n=1 Tax=Camellia sinensis var. sinensis TaxID=542762 RepID=A0A4S4DJL3_CAMSN|nr:hypothetical protein TEA_010734 [Camellia sinensis var. sinensis]